MKREISIGPRTGAMYFIPIKAKIITAIITI
jgi:hypothetical protein